MSAQPAQQQLVDPNGALLTILLPIMPSQLELGYARNQLRTFSRFFDLRTVHEILVVTPPEHLAEVSHFYQHTMPTELASIDPHLFRVIHDGQCVPELDPASERYQLLKPSLSPEKPSCPLICLLTTSSVPSAGLETNEHHRHLLWFSHA